MVMVQRSETGVIDQLDPHYSNPEFSRGQTHTVFLANGYKLNNSRYPTVEGAEYNYDDRIRQWDWDKSDAAWKYAIAQVKDRRSAECFQAYLRAFFGRPALKLVHIITGVNVGNGYSYKVFGYIPGDAVGELVTLPTKYVVEVWCADGSWTDSIEDRPRFFTAAWRQMRNYYSYTINGVGDDDVVTLRRIPKGFLMLIGDRVINGFRLRPVSK